MLQTVVLYLIPCLIRQSYQLNTIAKCCGSDSEILTSGPELGCTRKNQTRLQIHSHAVNFLENATDGRCVDFEGKTVFLYQLNQSTLQSKTQLTQTAVPKCCPLRHLYNNQTHSCSHTDNYTEDFLAHQLVKVGLPHCRLILDETFPTYVDAVSRASKMNAGNYCLDRDVEGKFVVRECRDGLDICQKKRCIKKCCPDGQSFIDGSYCRDTYVHGLKMGGQTYSPYIVDINDKYELLYGVGCRNVSILRRNTYQYKIEKNGSYTYYHNFTSRFEQHHYSNFESYCLEYAKTNKVSGYHFFLCKKIKPLEEKFALTAWSKMLSCICLLITVLVYFLLGEHKSTFGKILINYCLAMICLMATLLVIHLSHMTDTSPLECKIRGYLLIYFNISAFAWVNVMSLDIWWTVGTPKRTIGSAQKRKDLKKFLLYFAYAWGLPLCHSLLILIFDMVPVLPESIQPHVGVFKCFLENRPNNYSTALFLLAPELISEFFNFALFIKTAVYCIRVKNEIRRMSNKSAASSNYTDVHMGRLILVVKLAVIMGVAWAGEVTSIFMNYMMKTIKEDHDGMGQKGQIIVDTIIGLQGVFIFVVFICKKRTTSGIKRKLGLMEEKSVSGSTLTSVNSSRQPGFTNLASYNIMKTPKC